MKFPVRLYPLRSSKHLAMIHPGKPKGRRLPDLSRHPGPNQDLPYQENFSAMTFMYS